MEIKTNLCQEAVQSLRTPGSTENEISGQLIAKSVTKIRDGGILKNN